MRRSVVLAETEERANRPLVLRLENWGRCLRVYVPGWSNAPLIGGDNASAEKGYRSGFREHGENKAIGLDVHDAKVIESAVTILPLYQHTMLKAWYVKQRDPDTCLRLAAKAGERKKLRFSAFDSELEMAHALLTEALALPAVIRKERARDYVRGVLA